jgi:hypothetical protein
LSRALVGTHGKRTVVLATVSARVCLALHPNGAFDRVARQWNNLAVPQHRVAKVVRPRPRLIADGRDLALGKGVR